MKLKINGFEMTLIHSFEISLIQLKKNMIKNDFEMQLKKWKKWNFINIYIKTDCILTSVSGRNNKRRAISMLPFSVAIANGVLLKKILFFEISLKIFFYFEIQLISIWNFIPKKKLIFKRHLKR